MCFGCVLAGSAIGMSKHRVILRHILLEVVRTIVTLAATLNIDVVAEGVETQQQRQVLNALKVKYAQGFLFFRPLAASQVSGLLDPAGFPLPIDQPLTPVAISFTQVETAAAN